jgi:hypothetical protein
LNDTINTTRLERFDGLILGCLQPPGHAISINQIFVELTTSSPRTQTSNAKIKRSLGKLRDVGYDIHVKQSDIGLVVAVEPSSWPDILLDGSKFLDLMDSAERN